MRLALKSILLDNGYGALTIFRAKVEESKINNACGNAYNYSFLKDKLDPTGYIDIIFDLW